MVCSSCGRTAKAGARFCGGCGASLAPRCPACGAECEPDLRFCEACGAALAAGSSESAVARKVVTIVFADLIGSTALHERLDPESVSRVMARYHEAVRAPIEAHGGTVVQLLGDGVMCAFGVPRVAEDDALRAVRAAVEVQRSFRAFLGAHGELAGRVGLRVAVNTGEVVVSDDYAAGIGDPLNVAARLQQEAKDGDVLLGESTQRLVAERVTLERVGSFALKGRAEPVTAWRVVSLDRPAGAAATPFVGREDELRRLTSVYDAALAAPAARLAVLLGSPGLGKSRLLDELARRLAGRSSVITAQCNPAGGATFAPLAEALRAHLGLETSVTDEALRAAVDAGVPGDDAERAGIAAGLGALLAGAPALPEETFFAVRRLLAALATQQPVVLVIDDLQWAEPLLLDFIEHLVQWGAGVPLLVLAAARPELRDARSSLTNPGGLVSDVVTLTGLDAGAAMRLAANVIGADTLPAAVAGRVLATSEGNPLFVGELVRMLVNDGVLRKEGERWSLAVDLSELDMPPTIQALLAARLERLRPEERLVLERAAVVGRQFSRAAITHLLPREAHADLDARLEALRRSELIEADAGWLLGEPALRFHHVLIRDAAYRRVLRGTRAELHGRFADWLEARVGKSPPHDETIGWHLEQAHQHLRELGPLDANAHALGARAARDLAAAGRRALARDELQPAASLLGRALACLADADPSRAELALDWCEALLSAGDVALAGRALAELARFTSGSERLAAWHTCFGGQLAALADPKALRASAAAVAAAAEALAAAGDVAGEAKAHQVHADALARLGEIGACEAALDKALAAARRAPDRRRANAVLAGAPLAALWGPSPVTRASGRCLDVVRVLRITQGAPAVEAVALRCQAVLEALRGRSEAARRMIASSRRLVEELGITQRLLEVDASAGLIELLEGDAAAAEGSLSKAYEGFREHGLGVAAAQAAALLGRALLAQGRAAEAEALTRESEALAGDDFKAAIAWRGVRAEVLAGRGEPAAGLELARAAVEIAAATDDLLDHADAHLALAETLRAAGRRDEAEREEARAAELWEQKGATLLAERARRRVASVAPPDRAPEARAERPRPERRRVQSNAATANAVELSAAIAARDAAALPTLIADDIEIVHGPTQSVYGREGALRAWLSVIETRDGALAVEPLATLGDSLALCRQRMSASGAAGEKFDFGAWEVESIALVEVDAQGRRRRAEFFAGDRLGGATARLYERYAELLPDGPERARAAATARTVAAGAGPLDLDRYAAVLAPDLEFVDHRPLGLQAARGSEALLHWLGSLTATADDLAIPVDDVLAVRPDQLLVHRTTRGSLRAGGGPFELQALQLFVVGTDGLAKRIEWFAPDQLAEAFARFDELTTEPPPARPVRRRVRANAATENVRAGEVAVNARDTGAFDALLVEGATSLDHTTGAELDRPRILRDWRSSLRAEDFRFVAEPLATLGDRLALCRNFGSASGVARGNVDVGAYEREMLVLVEVDAGGRRQREELFATRSLGDAVVRLYERYAELLPDGPARARAAMTARAIAAMVGPVRLDRYAAAFAPAIEAVDYRTLGTWSARGAEALLEHFRSSLELTDDAKIRSDEVLGLRSDAVLERKTHLGTLRAGGGAYERQFILLSVFGVDGLMTRIEWFDADRDVEALARFDELTAEDRPARPIRRRVRPNAATANAARLDVAIAARDADALESLIASDAENLEHTTGARYGRSETLAFHRRQLRVPDLAMRHEPLATLGDSLALCHLSVSGSGAAGRTFDVGAFEFENVLLFEVDAHGRRRRLEIFPADRLGDAVARLYERYAELLPEGTERTRAAATARSVAAMPLAGPIDIDRWASVFAPDIEGVDPRTVGFGSLHGAEELLRAARAFRQLVEDPEGHVEDVLALRSDALLVRGANSGTQVAGGGSFERTLLVLWAFGADGLLTHWEQCDVEREVEALARFDELVAEPPPARFANAATRSWDRFREAWEARDWERVCAGFALEFHGSDRRPTMLLELGRAQQVEFMRAAFELSSSRFDHEVLATRGDRLALARLNFEGAERDAGPSEIESLIVAEVNESGERVASVRFDLDDLDAAYAELDGRYGAGEGALHARVWETSRRFASAIAARDWPEVSRMFAPDLVAQDHRVLGHGDERDDLLAYFRVMAELAPDVRLRVDHVLALDDRRSLTVERWVGTREGGAFEIPFVIAAALSPDGRLRAIHTYDLDQLDAARARFEALAASAPRDPLAALVKPNAATAAVDRLVADFEARDWDALRALAAARFEDRRRQALISGDADWWVRDLELAASYEEGVHFQRQLVATAGDRVGLEHVLLAGGPAEGRVEIEYLWLAEVDDAGRLVAGVMFDADDRRAAQREAVDRWLARDAVAAAVVGPAVELLEAWNTRDRARMRSVLVDDFVHHDRRLTGEGRGDGADAFLENTPVMWDLTPDVEIEPCSVLALQRHGVVVLTRAYGTLPEGGAFDLYVVHLATVARDRVTRLEMFEIEHSDAALARLAELRPDPLRIPPNAATRARDRSVEAWKARDWDALRALASPDFRYEDRSKGALVSGGVETWIADNRFMQPGSGQRELIGTAGERIAIERDLWIGAPDGGPVEIENLRLTEVDADGRIRAVLWFDPDDRAAAFAEVHARFAAGEGAAVGGHAPLLALGSATRLHDWEAHRNCLAEDAVIWDRRTPGILGTLGRDQWAESLQAAAHLAPDLNVELVRILTWNRLGGVHMSRMVGTRDGGPFENIFLNVLLIDRGRIQRNELFDPADTDRALARFEELCAPLLAGAT